MDCLRTAIAIGKALRTNSAFNGVYLYAHDREIDADGTAGDISGPQVEGVIQPQIRLPRVEIQVSGESLCGSATIGRMKAELILSSQSDDETATVHNARENAIRAVMANTATLTAAFTATGNVLLKGRAALTTNAPGIEARAYSTPLTYILGVEAV